MQRTQQPTQSKSGYKINITGLRAGDSKITEDQGRYTATLKYIALIIIIFFIGFWFVTEYMDYMPINKRIETFLTPRVATKEPRPVNDSSLADTTQLDLDILRSNRYHTVTIRKQDPDDPSIGFDPSKPEFVKERSPLSNLASLNQELPTTYMLDMLSKILPLTINFPDPSPIQFLLARQPPNGPEYNPKTPIYNFDRLDKLTSSQLTNDPALKHLFEAAKLNIITAINLEALKQKQSHPNHPFSTFRIIQSEFLSLKHWPGTGDGELRMIINMVLHRPFKTHTFNIQAQIKIRLTGAPYSGQVSGLELVGSTIQNQVNSIGPSGVLNSESANQTGAPLTSTPINRLYPGMNIAMSEPESPIDFDATRRKTFEEARTKLEAAEKGIPLGFLERSRDGGIAPDPLAALVASGKYLNLNYNGDYKCFTVTKDGTILENQERGKSAVMCQSTDPATGMNGVWDNPCKSDDECPFYKANKNYTNSFGGCMPDGKCQLPSGLDQYQVGFKKYHKAGLPFTQCYNCPSDPNTGLPMFNCCDNQLAVSGTPDFRFAGDETLRNRPDIVSELASKGLAPA